MMLEKSFGFLYLFYWLTVLTVLAPFNLAKLAERWNRKRTHDNVKLLKEGLVTFQFACSVYYISLAAFVDTSNSFKLSFIIFSLLSLGFYGTGLRAIMDQDKAIKKIHKCENECHIPMSWQNAFASNVFETIFAVVSLVIPIPLLSYVLSP